MSYCIPSCPFTFRGTPQTTKSRTSLKRMSLVTAHKASSGMKPADVVSIDLQAADSWLSCHMFALVTKCGLSPSSARRAHWNWTESRWRWNNTLKKDESQDALDIGMIQAWWSTFVLDVSGRKCAEVLFRHGTHVFDRCFGSAASHPSAPQLLTSNKSHALSPLLLWTWPNLYSQYATSSLIIVGYWSLCESNDLSAAGGMASEWCIAWRPDCHVVCLCDDFPMKGTTQRCQAAIVLFALCGRAASALE